MDDFYELFDPKVDYIFKRLFGVEENKDMLISLLNSILRRNPVIKSIDLNNVNYPNCTKRERIVDWI